jgi:hypothetical protein
MQGRDRNVSYSAVMLGVIVCVAAAGFQLEGLLSGGRDHPAIAYSSGTERNAIAELNARLGEGSAHLQFVGRAGYLRSVLDALDVPVESQMMVFSKTSLQKPLIAPENPRSIFFNDAVVVAWVRGEPFIEVAAEDAQKGVIFYTLDYERSEHPIFLRRDSCLSCHESYSSLGVPGMLVRSVFPAPNGMPLRPLGDFNPDDRSPFHERWGGWYVTGNSGPHKHLGNRTFAEAGENEPLAVSSDLERLDGKFEMGGYLSPYSDIVALMVFEHQMRTVNLLTRSAWEARLAASEGRGNTAVENAAAEIADDLLFLNETPLLGTVKGSSGFAEKFTVRGPSDSEGRSLRQLDLTRHMTRYPCSYMVYSPGFDGLPANLKDATYRRMWQILSGSDPAVKSARMTAADRRAVVEILRQTKKDLPAYFH